MNKQFDIIVDNKTFFFELDRDGLVWLIDEKNGNSNRGQEQSARSIDEAKEIARIMLYAMGKAKRP